MIDLLPWLERSWVFGQPARLFPATLERLRGTPARARALTADVDAALLTRHAEGRWSAQEHIAHLDDLHELDVARLEAFRGRADVLPAADMTNQRTHTANHNARSIADVLARFERRRIALVESMDALGDADVEWAALHPRLKQRIRLADWAYFVAEHDDHHLVRARRALDL